MKVQDVLRCSFSSWYPSFRNITFKSKIIPLPEEVRSYILSDGLVIPSCACDAESENVDSDYKGGEAESAPAPFFPEFTEQMTDAIRRLGGAVLPKLNWSSPKDAAWIAANNEIKCNSPADVYLLLKSSDFISHDLLHPFKGCDDLNDGAAMSLEHELVLRRWHDVHPGGEFRCFVRHRCIVGISQRHHANFFDFIRHTSSEIVDDIISFFASQIRDKFSCEDYVVDVYRKSEGKVYLVDFNPFSPVCDGLLFDWNELLSDRMSGDQSTTKKPDFRFVQDELGVQPSPYASYGLPLDFNHLRTGEDPYKLVDFLKLQQRAESISPQQHVAT